MALVRRGVTRTLEPVSVVEGAGVKLIRSIASQALDYLDPFLLLDDFRSKEPADFLRGFPWHPHRGIETVTYMLEGFVNHRDSLGNEGRIGAGDVQWMTAGSGIMHEEMPEADDGKMGGFQLWINLPAKEKMTTPRYQDVPASAIPEIKRNDGTKIRLVAGEVNGTFGPIREIAANPQYLDVYLPANTVFSHPILRGHTAFAYLFEGVAQFKRSSENEVETDPRLIVYGDGDFVEVKTGEQSARFLLVSGKPLGEPVARYGPFVMNTRAEIEQALQDLRNGTFIREQPSSDPDQWYGVE